MCSGGVVGAGVTSLVVTIWLLMTCSLTSCELLQNGGFEHQLTGWKCWGAHCEVLGAADSHQGNHAIRTHNRTHYYQGPSQVIQTTPGKEYHAQSWVKILNDVPGKLGQKIQLEISFHFSDGTVRYENIAMRPLVTTANGWFFMKGEFQAPPKAAQSVSFYYQGPEPGVDFAVDQASVTEVPVDNTWRNQTDDVINRLRKSDIQLHVTTDSNIDTSRLKIQSSRVFIPRPSTGPCANAPSGKQLDWIGPLLQGGFGDIFLCQM
ncbi:endo-1,4-beta-xylanase A-like [Babylonia areolata]|uniref:endo-1,4-beta-xylanase A-like n=1 Tax=Babylonia areolata TaxID=304850 RepID=UPI003FD1E8B3